MATPKTHRPRNLVGPTVRKLRVEQGLSQPQLAAVCQRMGWDISRDIVARIEGQVRWVSDFEIIGLALALRVDYSELMPTQKAALNLLNDM